MFNDDNPYASPTGPSKGVYDWTLAKRVFVAVAVVLLMWLVPAFIVSYRAFKQLPTHPNKSPVSAIVSFLSDWRSPS